MENPTQLQLMQAAVFLSAGIAAGLVYDVCRAVRRCSGRWMCHAVDALFVFAAAWLLFVLGMLVGEGQLRIFMVGCLMFGAMAYSAACSELVVPALCRGLRALKRLTAFAKIPLEKAKKLVKSTKNLFPKRRVWSKMNGYRFIMPQYGFKRTRIGKDAENNHETDGMDGLYRAERIGDIRRVEHSSGTVSSDSSRSISGGADRSHRSSRRRK